MNMSMTRTLPDPIYDAAFYAGVPVKRLIAWVFDVILIAVITAVPVILTLGILGFVWPILFIVMSFLYRWMTLAGGSATFGMRLMSLEIRNARGQRLDRSEAMLHTLAYMVTAAIFPLLVISAILMLTGARRQGLHDMLLGTAAINRPR